VKRRVFWVIARTCFALYRQFPLFGSLRASIAIIHRDGKFLVIRRNDGRGLSLPGGIAGFRESEESALRREVQEETGLSVSRFSMKTRYHSTVDVPCLISVYEVEASGGLRDSWEGSPDWMSVAEIELRLLESQKPVLALMRQMIP
jgi:8-oxo-dGTP pyrophosphatase MutT (NUDIX family)